MAATKAQIYDLCHSSDEDNDEDDEVICLGSDGDVKESMDDKNDGSDEDEDDDVQVLSILSSPTAAAASVHSRQTTDRNKKRKAMDSIRTISQEYKSHSDDDDEDDEDVDEEEVKLLSVKKAPVPTKASSPLPPTTNLVAHPRPRKFKCSICMEDSLDMSAGYSLSSCGHRFCVACLANLVKFSQTTTTSSYDTLCPNIKCKKPLQLIDIRYIYRDDPNGWKAYSKRANMALLEREIAMGKGSTRRCPAERCNFTFCFDASPNPDSLGTLFDCPACQASFCLNCKANGGAVGPAHAGVNCHERLEQLQRQAEERRKLRQWKKENAQADVRFKEMLDREAKRGVTKPCPRCKTPIHKHGGCDHMHCTQCKLSYNWSKS